MARIRVPSGTIQKLEKVFDNLQTTISTNQLNRLSTIISGYGVLANMQTVPASSNLPGNVQPVDDSSLQVTVATTSQQPTRFTINPGNVLTQANKYININTAHTQDAISGAQGNSYYLVRLRYVEQGGESMTAMNSFLYDPTVEGTTKYTKFTDVYSVETVKITQADGFLTSVNPNEAVPLAILKSDAAAKLMNSSFTFVDATTNLTYTASSGVIDLRGLNPLRLDHKLLDDSQVLLKDRSSTQTTTGELQGSLGVQETLTVGSFATISGQLQTRHSLKVNGNSNNEISVGTLAYNTAGVPLKVSNIDTIQSLADGGNGHIAHFFGGQHPKKRLTIRERSNAMSIYAYDTDNSPYYCDLEIGAGTNRKIIAMKDGQLIVGRDTTNSILAIHTNDIKASDIEALALSDGGMVISHGTNSTHGITWRRGSYSKESLAIRPVDLGNFSRAGLGFYTNNTLDETTNARLGMAIGRTGKVFIGYENPNYSADEPYLLNVDGPVYASGQLFVANTGGVSTLTGGVVISENLTVGGTSIFTGRIDARGGIDLGDMINCSGITSHGPISVNLLNPEVNALGVKLKTESGALVDKGGWYLDNSLSSAIRLGAQSPDKFWADISTSGIYFDEVKDVSIGHSGKTVTPLFEGMTSLFGKGPALLLRASSLSSFGENVGTAENNDNATDWYIGSPSTFQNTLRIGHFLSPTNAPSILTLSKDGNIGIGAEVRNGFKLSVPGNIYTQGITAVTEVNAERVKFKANQSDVDYSAGVTAEGVMFIGTSESNTAAKLIVGGSIEINSSEITESKVIFGGSSSQSFEIGLKDATTLSASKGGDILWEASTASGISAGTVTATTVVAGDIELTKAVASDNVKANSLNITTSAEIAQLTVTEGADFQAPAEEINISGTSATDFRIGVGSLGTSSLGVKVVTESLTATNPTNLRINDIKPFWQNDANSASIIEIKSNYDFVEGYGLNTPDLGEFKVTSPVIDEEEDDLKGKNFVLQHGSGTNTYVIDTWNNTTKVLGLLSHTPATGEGQGPAYNNETAVGPNFGTIIDVADDINLQFVETDQQGIPVLGAPVVATNTQGNINTFGVYLELNKYYKAQVRARKGTVWSDWSLMGSGIYDPDQTTASGQSPVSYGVPFYNALPMLDSSDASVNLVATAFGFKISINGFNGDNPETQARQFEIGYAKSPKEVDFSNKTDTDQVLVNTTSRSIDINTPTAATYNVKVRPLQNNQVVGTTLKASILSGAGGVPPNYVNFFSGECNVVHYAGTIADASTAEVGGTDNSTIKFSTLTFTTSPFTTVSSGIVISENELANVGGGQGQTMEMTNSGGTVSYGTSTIVQNTTYNDTGGGTTMTSMVVMNDQFDSGYAASGNKFVINGSKDGRKIAEFSLGADVNLKLITLDIAWATGVSSDNPGVLRVYQKGLEASAGTMSVSISSGMITAASEVEILAAQGPRTVIVDLFDPDNTSPNNTCSVVGSLNIYGTTITEGTQQQSTN